MRLNATKQNEITSKLDWLAEHLESVTQCPLCSSSDWKLLFQLGTLSIYRCRCCKMMFLNPFLKPEMMAKIFSSPELLERISRFFSDYHEESAWNTPRTLSIYQSVLSEIEHYLPGRGKLLDVGCGKGTFLKLAKDSGWQGVGVEPGFQETRFLREEHGIEVFRTDFFQAPLPENGHDAVSLWDLIEHVPNPVDWVKRCYKITKRGGLLIVATPNHFSLLDLLALFGYRVTFGKFTYALEKLYTVDHTLYFTDKTLKRLLESEGFSVVKSMKVNTDLSRYSMNASFRLIAEGLLTVSRISHLHNRIIMIARKNR